MATDWEQIRKHQRVLFAPKNHIMAVFSTQGTATDVKVMDLSLGGLSCSMLRRERDLYQSGDRLVIREINDGNGLKIPMNTEIEIKWVMDIAGFNNVGFGCQFLNLADEGRKRLAQFIDGELKKGALKKQISDSKDYAKTSLS